MRRRHVLSGVISIFIVVAGLFLVGQMFRSPIRDFTVYDPPFVLNDVIEGKEFSEMNRSDPLETMAAFYLVANADQKLSLYTEEELGTGSRKKVLLMGNPWEDSGFRKIAEKIRVIFSFRYAGKFGPQGWHVVVRDPSDRLFWNWMICNNGKWYYVMGLTDEKPGEYVCNLFLKSGFREKSSLNEDEICEFRKQLEQIDKVIKSESQ